MWRCSVVIAAIRTKHAVRRQRYVGMICGGAKSALDAVQEGAALRYLSHRVAAKIASLALAELPPVRMARSAGGVRKCQL